MFQSKINIYKVIKMLAKIKHDEDYFNRPLAIDSNWYKLSRTKIDYRQVAYDKINRARPGLVDQIFSHPPEISFSTVYKEPFRSTGKKEPGETIGHPENSLYSHRDAYGRPMRSRVSIVNDNYRFYRPKYLVQDKITGQIRTATHWEAVKEEGGSFWFESDVHFMWRYDTNNWWWFDLCLQPEVYVLNFGRGGGGVIMGGTSSDENGLVEYWKHSPSRDLATATFLEFATMQDNPQRFISKTTYLTAPYMPFVEQQRIWTAPVSRYYFGLYDVGKKNVVYSTIYGIDNDIFRLFGRDENGNKSSRRSPSGIDRENRQKLFNDFFKALDGADWFKADELADELIKLTDSVGWSPYIGYGDMSLFIQRMNIPSEYIMTHMLTDFQDEVLTNAFAVNQLNNKISDRAFNIQKNSNITNLNSLENFIATENGYIPNITKQILYDRAISDSFRLRKAISEYTLSGGRYDELMNILENTLSIEDTLSALQSKSLEIVISQELKNVDKIE